jgi:protein-S-isoprenylcysteine O-methyltransferase Ste14
MRDINYLINLLFKYGTASLFAVSVFNSSNELFYQFNTLSLFKLIYSLVFLIAVLKIKTKINSDTDFSTIFIVLIHLTIPLLMAYEQNNNHSITMATLVTGSIGSLLSFYSLIDLGNCFYILPVNSQIKIHGMYSIIRHPIYFGYILIVFSKFISSVTFLNFILMLLFFVFTILRIFKEENLLKQNTEYLNYIKNVKFRLIPWVY